MRIVGLILLAAISCSNPIEWQGIVLPSGVRTEPLAASDQASPLGDSAVQVGLVFQENLGYGELRDRLDTSFTSPWQSCPALPTQWGESIAGQPRFGAWVNAPEKRLALFAHDTELQDGIPPNRLTSISDNPEWELHHRAFCADVDRSLFSPWAVISLGYYCRKADRSTRFTSDAWIGGDESARGAMAADLMCTGRLLGLGREEVVRLLGAPDHQEGDSLRYELYLEGGFGRWHEPILDPSWTCREGRYQLRVDFSLEIPGEANAAFDVVAVCEENR